MRLPKHIMIVEDEVITQRYLKDILKHYGVEAVECYDSAKGVRGALKASNCEMVLMDINIKGSIDGIQLAREMQQYRSLPVIFITAHSDQDTFQEVLDLSPYGFIAKPFSAKDIEMTLQIAYTRFLEQERKKAQEEEQKKDPVVIDEHYSYAVRLGRLYKDGQEVKLNGKQLKLIDILCRNIDHTVDYATLEAEIWGNKEIAESALRTLVYFLRKQLPDFPLISHCKIGYSIKRA